MSVAPQPEEYVVHGSTTGCDGTYTIMGATWVNYAAVNGRFIWEHTTEDRAMYLANNGYWKVSTKANARTGDGAAYMLLRGHTDEYRLSSLDTRQWKEAVDKVWTY